MTFISISALGRLRGFFQSCSLETPVWAAGCCSLTPELPFPKVGILMWQSTAPLTLEGTSGGVLFNLLLQDGWLWDGTRVLRVLSGTLKTSKRAACFTASLQNLQNLFPIPKSVLLMLWFMPMASHLPLESLEPGSTLPGFQNDLSWSSVRMKMLLS